MIANDDLRILRNAHKDFVHDTAFNLYGTRMATCSSDGIVRIYDLHDDDTLQQSGVISLPSPTCPIIRVTWAHPEFGGILATASYGQFVNVWYEKPIGPNDPSEFATKWEDKGTFWDAFLFNSSEQRSSNSDGNANQAAAYNTVAIQFAPKHLGLLLATAFFDGRVRIYDFQGSSNVALKEEIQTKMSALSCISWSTARHHPRPLLAVGSDDCNTTTGAKLQLWEYDPDRKAAKVDITSMNNTLLQNAIKDVQFAPNFGQSYHLLAVASTNIDLFKIKPVKELNNSSDNKAQAYDIARIITMDDHGSTVWKVCWNVFGSVLYSCGDDGRIRMWKGTINGPWICVDHLSLQAEALQKAKADTSQSTESVSQ